MSVALAFGTFAALDIGRAIADLGPVVLYTGLLYSCSFTRCSGGLRT